MDMKTMMAGLMVAVALAGCASEAEPTDEDKPAAAEVKAPIEEDTATPSYGSTYNSNCFCSFCTKYCTVDGTTYKNGTCC